MLNINKVSGLFSSRRFWLAIGGVVFVAFDAFGLGLSPEQVNHMVLLGGAWIVGDSLRAS